MADPHPIESRGVHHIAFTTRDVEATYEFYTHKLGMRLLHAESHRQGEGYFRHFFFGMGGGESIAFFQLEGVGEDPDFKTEISKGLGLPTWANHIAFRLDNLEEIKAMTKRMHEHGIDQVMEIDHGWCTSIYALDPNGLALGLDFTGIVVAALARYNPLAVVFVAVFLAGLRNAGVALQSLPGKRVPVEVSLMLQGTILLFAIGGEIFARYRLSVARTAQAQAEAS